MKKTWTMLKDDSGAALMMAIFTVTMLMIIATEIMYETNVEFAVSSQSVNQVKAHYAAKAGTELSLLRLHIYRKVTSMIPQDMLNAVPMIDMIWQMPFAWPPMVPESTNMVDKSQIKEAIKKSAMQGSYMATIESESSKIDLSLLAVESPDPHKPSEIVKSTQAQLLQIFQNKIDNDEAFARKHNIEEFKTLIGNIKDWVDPDEKSDTGGDERSLYSNLNAGDKYPPNQPFKTFEELHMVAGMTDEIYQLLLPRVTIYGAKAINVKYASKETLMAGLKLTEEQAGKVIEERGKKDTQVFKDANSFLEFVASLGVRKEDLVDSNTKKPLINILVEPEFNFRVKVVGTSGKVQREITAVVYDYDRVLTQLRNLQPPNATPTPNPAAAPPSVPAAAVATPTPAPSKDGNKPAPNERPNIVYWNET